ncbi:cysteine hydrolase family protein [Microbacterium horticulturae]|uniref:Cysteine hydrolase family protein n=1 Tax=Microbacterium horticulturae TaxID=3028316 RepID=A0ABY8C4J3_9MICO|nr:cysteine hydrolase family protein [Microbacterium sp. KACC 23027]WEG10095.1 cysteine hydrolase family protein [Microbacterium sp. KACC 23027]
MPLQDLPETTALVVIDMQQGFTDPSWGVPVDLDGCRTRVRALVDAFESARRPVVVVRHDSDKPSSPLRRDAAGNAFFDEIAAVDPAVLITKTVNSAFLGTPDLDGWLRERGIDTIVVCGIQTNMCVETTARMGGNLGYRVVVPLDATTTFPLTGAGESADAETLIRITAVNLAGGGFAQVAATADVVAASMREEKP